MVILLNRFTNSGGKVWGKIRLPRLVQVLILILNCRWKKIDTKNGNREVENCIPLRKSLSIWVFVDVE
jgi:hypothetical protein